MSYASMTSSERFQSKANFDLKSKINFKSMFFTGYLDGVESVRHKADSVPYERFPYCCSKDNTIKKEIDLAKSKNIMPKVRHAKQSPQKITVV